MASEVHFDGSTENKGSMWVLNQRLDQPMDEEAARIKNMYREKVELKNFLFSSKRISQVKYIFSFPFAFSPFHFVVGFDRILTLLILFPSFLCLGNFCMGNNLNQHKLIAASIRFVVFINSYSCLHYVGMNACTCSMQ